MTGREGQTNITDPDAADTEVASESATVDARHIVQDAEPDAADPKESGEVAVESASLDARRTSREAEARRVSVSVRTLLVAMMIFALLASLGFMAWLYLGAKAKLNEQARQAADNNHAERIALDYAVGAAKINFQDLDKWRKNLVNNTTPELKDKLNSAGTSMEQILTPLQWNSTATPLVAKVRSNAGGIYVVDAFVGVDTKTVQAPDGLQSTATYGITIDSSHDWRITDVGGIGAVVGHK